MSQPKLASTTGPALILD